MGVPALLQKYAVVAPYDSLCAQVCLCLFSPLLLCFVPSSPYDSICNLLKIHTEILKVNFHSKDPGQSSIATWSFFKTRYALHLNSVVSCTFGIKFAVRSLREQAVFEILIAK